MPSPQEKVAHLIDTVSLRWPIDADRHNLKMFDSFNNNRIFNDWGGSGVAGILNDKVPVFHIGSIIQLFSLTDYFGYAI